MLLRLVSKMSIQQLLSIADEYPDLVTRLHTQARPMGNFGLNASVPWQAHFALFVRRISKIQITFLLDCPQLKESFDSTWRNLNMKIIRSNLTDGTQIADFIKGLIRQHEMILLVGGLSLPFDHETTTQIKRFISSVVGKIYKLRTKKSRELEAQWLTG